MPRQVNVGGISFSINAETGEFKGAAETAARALKTLEQIAKASGRSVREVATTYNLNTQALRSLREEARKTAQNQKELSRASQEAVGEGFSGALEKQVEATEQAKSASRELQEEIERLGRAFTETGTESISVERALQNLAEKTKEIQVVSRLIDLARVKQETTTATNFAIQEEKRLTAAVESQANIRAAVGRTEQAIIRDDNARNNQILIAQAETLEINRREAERRVTELTKLEGQERLANIKNEGALRLAEERRIQQVRGAEQKAQIARETKELENASRIRLEELRSQNKQQEAAQRAALDSRGRLEAEQIQIRREQRKAVEREERDAVRAQERVERQAEQANRRRNREEIRRVKRLIAERRRLNQAIISNARGLINFRTILGTGLGTGLIGAVIRDTTTFSATLVETAQGLGTTASELDITRRTFESFGLEALQVDRALTNIAESTIKARQGIIETQRAFEALDIPDEIRNPLEILRFLNETVGQLDPSIALESIGTLVGERARTVFAGLLSTGQFEIEFERQAQIVGQLNDEQLQRNKDLDQTFVDLTNIIRRNFIEQIATYADQIESYVRIIQRGVPILANAFGSIANFALGPGGIAAGAGIGAGVGLNVFRSIRDSFNALEPETRKLRVGMVRSIAAFSGLGVAIGLAAKAIDDYRIQKQNETRALQDSEEILRRNLEIGSQQRSGQLTSEQAELARVRLVASIRPRSILNIRRTIETLTEDLARAAETAANPLNRLFGTRQTQPTFIQEEINLLQELINLVDEYNQQGRNRLNVILQDQLDAEIRTLTQSINEWERFNSILVTTTNTRNILRETLTGIELQATLDTPRALRESLILQQATNELLTQRVQLTEKEIRLESQRIEGLRNELILNEETLMGLELENKLRDNNLRLLNQEIIAERTRNQARNTRLAIQETTLQTREQENILDDEEIRNLDNLLQLRKLNLETVTAEVDIHRLINVQLDQTIQRADHLNELKKLEVDLFTTFVNILRTSLQIYDQRFDLRRDELQVAQKDLAILQAEEKIIRSLFEYRSDDLIVRNDILNTYNTQLKAIQAQIAAQQTYNNLLNDELRLRQNQANAAVALTAALQNVQNIGDLGQSAAGSNIENIARTLTDDLFESYQNILAAQTTNFDRTLSEIFELDISVGDEARNFIQNVERLYELTSGTDIIPQEELEHLREMADTLGIALLNTDGLYVESLKVARSIALWDNILKSVASTIVDIAVGLTDADVSLRSIVGQVGKLLQDVLKIYLTSQLTNFLTDSQLGVQLATRQTGGFASGLTLVGEGGPELVDFRRSGRVYGNPVLQRLINQGSNGGNRFNIVVNSDNPAAVRAEVINLLPLIEEAASGRNLRDMQTDSPNRRELERIIRQ